MRTQLITITAPDGTELDGAFYTDDNGIRSRSRRKVVHIVHGRTMNFYVGLPRALPPLLVARGFDVLALNQRAAGVIAMRDDFQGTGDARSSVRPVVLDVEAGQTHLKDLGYRSAVLVGHSSGAFLAGHVGCHDPFVEALVFASPYPFPHGLTLPEEQWAPFVARAQELLAGGAGDELVLLPRGPFGITTWVMSAHSVVEATRNRLPPLFVTAARCAKPQLILFGDHPMEQLLQERCRPLLDGAPQREIVHVSGADHFYKGKLYEVAEIITSWIARSALASVETDRASLPFLS